MNAGRQQDLFDDAPGTTSREGAFDGQLSFSTTGKGSPEPIRTVVKRSGREEGFDSGKIREAILRAAHPDDEIDDDVASSLASGVVIYLRKRIRTGPPMAETVAQAVEELLFAMGHNRTGIAFVRYRDRRQRIRRLRDGDVRTFLTELNEARRHTVRGQDEQAPFVVRTQDDGVGEWNRERIVDTLKRETGADDATAEVVAVAVEEQIRSAEIETLTASLVRELVDAQLIAIGRDDLRRRYMRLGVPLYDSEQIICAPNAAEGESWADPETTNTVLAQRVKREFALNHVFDETVASAHHEGVIHIHGLGTVDRVARSVQSAGLVTHFGAPLGTGRRRLAAPMYCETAIAHLAQLQGVLSRYHGGGVGWADVNFWLAALLEDDGNWTRRAAAQQLLSQFGQRGMGPAELHFRWELTEGKWDQLSLLLPPEKAGDFPSFRERMQALARTVLDELLLGDVLINRWMPFRLVFDLPRGVLDDLRGREYGEALIACALEGAPITVRLYGEDGGPGWEGVYWEPEAIFGGEVSLNVPQAAYRSGNRESFFAELERSFAMAVEAHVQKRNFLEKLYALGDAGPLSLMAQRWSGAGYMELDRMSWVVSVAGLNECVEHFFGKGLHESGEGAAFGVEVLERLDALCADYGKRDRLRLVLGQTLEPEARRRFATLDMRAYSEAALRVKIEGLTQDVAYTAGAQAAFGAKLTPMERLRLESEGHRLAGAGAVATIRVPELDNPVEGLLDLVQAADRGTAVREIVFVS